MRVQPLVMLAVIAAAAASRLLPHPPNFAPVAAMALFGGAHFADRRLAFVLPLAVMFLSDLLLGWHSLIPVVYGTFVLITIVGLQLRKRRTVGSVAVAAVSSSVLFFVVTNFAVWAQGSLYPRTLAGLMAAYVAAIPFFRNTLAGDLSYTTVLFGGFALLVWIFPALRESKASIRAVSD